MARNLTKEQALINIKKELKNVFNTQTEAALYFKVSRGRMSQMLSGDEPYIAPCLLAFMGYKKVEVETKYTRAEK